MRGFWGHAYLLDSLGFYPVPIAPGQIVTSSGGVGLFCYHTGERWTLPELYAGRRLRGPSLVLWALRLARAARAIALHVPSTPPVLFAPARSVLEAFLEIQALRAWPGPPDLLAPVPLSRRFLAHWTRLPEDEARAGLRYLVEAGYLLAERGFKYILYAAGPRLVVVS